MLAIYEDDGEWYDATVEAVRESDGWIEVNFDEYDDGETYVVPPENVEARADDGGDDDDGEEGAAAAGRRAAGCAAADDRQPVWRAAAALPIATAPNSWRAGRSQAVVLKVRRAAAIHRRRSLCSSTPPSVGVQHHVTQPPISAASPNVAASAARCRAIPWATRSGWRAGSGDGCSSARRAS